MEINNITPLPAPLNPAPANLTPPIDNNSVNKQLVMIAALNAAMKETLTKMVEADKASYEEKLANDPLQPLNQEQEAQQDWVKQSQLIESQEHQYFSNLENIPHQ